MYSIHLMRRALLNFTLSSPLMRMMIQIVEGSLQNSFHSKKTWFIDVKLTLKTLTAV